jgi:hypothetical protein
MHFWSSRDRMHYIDAITAVLRDYLLDDEGVAS